MVNKQMTETPASSATKRSRVQIYDEVVATPTSATSEPTLASKKLKNTSVDAFDRFYEENKDRIHMPPDQTYPRDEDAVKVVSDELSKSTQCDALLGRLLTVGLHHISFAQFYQALQQAAYEAVARCESENRNIYLFVYGDIRKSNLWCTLLVWPIIRQRVIKITSEGTFKINIKPDEKLMLLQVDDAMYAGQQVYQGMTTVRAQGYGEMYGSDGRLVWCVLVAAATSVGLQHVKTVSPIVSVLGEGTTLIKINTVEEVGKTIMSDADLAEAKRCAMEKDGFFAKTAQFKFHNFSSTITLTYLDHKMPDNYSTNNVAIAYAPTPGPGAEKMTLHHLVKGCKLKSSTGNIPKTNVVWRDFKLTAEDAQACPPSFVKTIRYLIKGDDRTFDSFSFGGRVENILRAYD